MRISLLGPLAVEADDGSAVPVGGPKQRAVLAVLALNGGRVVPTDTLVDGIWGEEPPASVLNSLQVYVHGLRKALGDPSLITNEPPGYRLAMPPVTTDVMEVQELRERARASAAEGDPRSAVAHLVAAQALWRGEPLADLRAMDFTTYVAVEMTESRLADLELTMDLRLALGEHREVLAPLEKLLAEHPTRERLWCQLLLALYRSDRQGDALTAFRRARSALADELGVDPGPSLRDLELAILRQDPELDLAPLAPVQGVAASAEPLRAPLTTRLPSSPHPLVGRDEQVGQVVASLRAAQARLVTITGPGGMGKTRTALEVARTVQDDFDTVLFVELATAVDGAGVLLELGSVLGLPPDDSSATAVTEILAGRRTLLVLDNLEQVTGAGTVVAGLLGEVEGAVVLATSRSPLRLSMERVHPLASLPPSGAADLFAARATAARPDFRLDDETRADVAALCRRLEGLPLALEMAAARVRLLPPRDILRRLESGLDRLGSGLADLPERQRTLAATAAWSLDLLGEEERALCARLTVFEAGFTIEAAAAVCGTDPDLVVDGIGTLIDSSLVTPLDTSGEARFRLYDVVCQFAGRQLEDDARSALLDAHAAWFLQWAEERAAHLDGPDHARTIESLTHEEPNLELVLSRTIGLDQADATVRLVMALLPYWTASGRLQRGCSAIDDALEMTGLDDEQRAVLRACQGIVNYHLTAWSLAVEQLSTALDVLPAASEIAARVRCHLGAALTVTGDPTAGADHAAVALEQAEAHDWYDVRVLALSALAIAAAISGDFEEETRRYRERLALVRAHGDRARTVDTLSTLAEIDVDEGSWESARRHAEEALSLVGPEMAAEGRDTLVVLARIALSQQDLEAATRFLVDALETSIGLGQAFGLAQVLRTTAGLAGALGLAHQAARLVGASDRLREDVVISDEVEVDLAGYAEDVRRSLPPAVHDEETEAGRSLTRDDAVALARQVLSGSSTAS